MNNYMEDLKEREERNGRLVNLIMDYAIENKMSAKDVDKCVEKAKEVFYSDARIIRTAREVLVQEQSVSTDGHLLYKNISTYLTNYDNA